MPPINQATISAGVIAVSVAVAAAIAIYESPELQRMAGDLRRRIALALHSLGDGIGGPQNSNDEPLFNRPEDAEGFLQTGEIDADDESRRRQREELLYWNAIKLSKELERQTDENEKVKEKEKMGSSGSGSTFDDFLREDKSADEKGTYVFNTGAEVRDNDEGLMRRRGASEGVRGLNASLYANPFADEHGIDFDDRMEMSGIAPGTDEVMSQDKDKDDIYNATPRHHDDDEDVMTNTTTTKSESRTMSPELVSLDPMPAPQQPETVSSGDYEYEYMTAGQSDRNSNSNSNSDADDAYASIQAWAEQQQQAQQHNRESSLAFYSPLPVTPAAPLSEAMSEGDGELVNGGGDGHNSSSDEAEDGQMTPTDSGSVAGSGVDVANELDAAASQKSSSSAAARYYDVLSEDEDGGMPTPAHSWTEVGSVVSESEDGSRGAGRV